MGKSRIRFLKEGVLILPFIIVFLFFVFNVAVRPTKASPLGELARFFFQSPLPTPTRTPTPPGPTNTPTPVPTCIVYHSTDVPITLPNGSTSISSNLTVPDNVNISDVNVSVDMAHTWVGDLSINLSHLTTDVNLLDRPGVPFYSNFGCSGDDILATLDSAAEMGGVENQCAGSIPTINGTFRPSGPLSIFNGEDSNGNWVLTVTDHYPLNDSGTLNNWGLEICYESEIPPTNTPTPIPPTNTPTPTPAPPKITVDLPSVTVDEGQVAVNGGSVSDSDGMILSVEASTGNITTINGNWSWSYHTIDGPADQTVTVTATDDDGEQAAVTFNLVVTNAHPKIDALLVPNEPVNIDDSQISTTVIFTDPGVLDTHNVLWTWGDGASDRQMDVTSPATQSHTYAEPGVYEVEVTVTDSDGASDNEVYRYIVIYDPDGGFITGGGWINSKPGDFLPDPSLTGKATFGFVSKYKKGNTIPTGNTQFQFNAADLTFHSNSYEWLVVTGGDTAKFKGEGTINGEPDPNGEPYKFQVWAGDGTDTDDADTFRIRIWYEDDSGEEIVIYVIAMDQPIDGGSIVVHKAK